MANIEEVQAALIEREKNLSASEESNRKLRAELELDKQAIARTIELLANPTAELPLDLTEEKRPTRRAVGVKKAVGDAANAQRPFGKLFSSRTIMNYLLNLPSDEKPDFDIEKNRANISSYLRDLVDEGMIEEMGEASGRRPATYRLTKDAAHLRDFRELKELVG